MFIGVCDLCLKLAKPFLLKYDGNCVILFWNVIYTTMIYTKPSLLNYPVVKKKFKILTSYNIRINFLA